MQLFPEFNEKMAAEHFDADAFMMLIKLGASDFQKFSGSTNLSFRKGTPTRPTFVRMELPENEAGFTRLKLHYVADDVVDMEFYTYTPMPGMKGLKSHVRVAEKVKYEYMGDVYWKMLGQEPADSLSEEY